jgi:hypothetical protein
VNFIGLPQDKALCHAFALIAINFWIPQRGVSSVALEMISDRPIITPYLLSFVHQSEHYGQRHFDFTSLLLSLAPQPSLGLGLLLKIRLNFLEASQQFSFSQSRVVSPTPNLHRGGPGLCIYIPQRQGGYPF